MNRYKRRPTKACISCDGTMHLRKAVLSVFRFYWRCDKCGCKTDAPLHEIEGARERSSRARGGAR